VVALFAMLLAVENDYQAAIMAPTELLAEQHVATLTPAGAARPQPDLLVGGSRRRRSRGARAHRDGASRVVVGRTRSSRRR